MVRPRRCLAGEDVKDVLGPRLKFPAPRVAAVIAIDTNERVGATEDKSDAVIRRLASLVNGESFFECPPRQEVGRRRSALRAWRVGTLRRLAVAHLEAPGHPLGALGELFRDVLDD